MRDDREQQLLKAVLKRATVNRPFREALLTDPHTAIEQTFGIKIPAHYRVRFVEREAGVDALIVLPDFNPGAGGGSDNGSEDLAGGRNTGEMTWFTEGRATDE